MANRLRTLDPQASPAALFGAELRALRLRRGLSLAALGRLVHVSGDLVGKIEKAERRPQGDLVSRLDEVLEAEGKLERLWREVQDDIAGQPGGVEPQLTADDVLPVLRTVIGAARADDHAMSERTEADVLVAHARAAERLQNLVGRADRLQLHRSIAEAYQLAGWMTFDKGRGARAEALLTTSRDWADRARDPALAAYVLGPNMSFVSTYGGDAARGAERAWGAIGWARRSGNRRLSAFTMAIAARAHARLGERDLCLDLLSDAESELDRHLPGADDQDWLSVFDRSALEGHRGSCLLDLGMPDHALTPLAQQEALAPARFVRNRIIWQLDRIDALLELREVEQACAELFDAIRSPIVISPRVQRRFRAVELRLRTLPQSPGMSQAVEQLHAFTEVYA